MGDPIEFRSLAIGQQFTCCMSTDTSDNPQLWHCIKDAPNLARQIGGVSFRLSGESVVYVKERQKTAIVPEPDHQPAYSVTVKEGMASMPWKDFAELTEKAALLDKIIELLKETK